MGNTDLSGSFGRPTVALILSEIFESCPLSLTSTILSHISLLSAENKGYQLKIRVIVGLLTSPFSIGFSTGILMVACEWNRILGHLRMLFFGVWSEFVCLY